MTALTVELVRARTVELFSRTIEAGGSIEEIIFERLVCDGCGRELNLLAEDPIGWTTRGDFERGFTDLCRSCSQ